MLKSPDESPSEIAHKSKWLQESNEDALVAFIDAPLAKFTDKVEEYKNGKKGLVGLFMGEVMKLSKGNADPKLANQVVRLVRRVIINLFLERRVGQIALISSEV